MMLQRGQALTEFLVVALALMPLFVLIPVIAKYQDISHSTQLASRYAAFDALSGHADSSGGKTESQLADEVRRRFFSNAGAAIKTQDTAGNFNAHRNLFWRDPNGNPLIKDFADIELSFGFRNAASRAAAFSAASDGAPFLLRDELDLPTRGIHTANVSVALANLPAGLGFFEPLDRLNLSIGRSTSVVFDTWAARDPEEVEARIGRSAKVFPAGALSAVSPLVDAAVSAIDARAGLSGPRLGRLDFWRDLVPQDRLRPRP